MTKLYHYKVASSNKVWDIAASNDTQALRQVKALCRVWKDTLIEVWSGSVSVYNRRDKVSDNWNCAT